MRANHAPSHRLSATTLRYCTHGASFAPAGGELRGQKWPPGFVVGVASELQYSKMEGPLESEEMIMLNWLVVAEPIPRGRLAASLRQAGVRTSEIGSVWELRKLLETEHRFDAVAAGLTLPDGNWWDVHQELRRHDCHAGVWVVLPDQGAPSSGRIQASSRGVLRPPFRTAEVRRIVARAEAAHAV